LRSADTTVIGIDARAAAEVPAGRGRVVRELLRELALRDDPFHYQLFARERWSRAQLDDRFSWQLRALPDALWHPYAAAKANRRCAAFLATNSYLTPWLLRIPTVLIVYDLVPFDQARLANRRSLVVERLSAPRAIRRARSIVAISDATAQTLARHFPEAQGKCTVAPLGVRLPGPGELTAVEADGLPEPGFVLSVGTLEPRKNIPRLIAAYERLDRALQDAHPLVLVGPQGWQMRETIDSIAALGDRCQLLGHVSDRLLAELYRRCALFCYPSLGEGFGLPVLEAMAAGAAVLTSNLSVLEEVAGPAAEYVDPFDTASIAHALAAILRDGDRREALARAGRERARKFSWAQFAERVVACVNGALGGSQASSRRS
jgi:glycosyltransferase involved in cell wall biosynthesis